MINCDMQEPKEQTIVRYLGGLKPNYANMVELQQFTTFHEACLAMREYNVASTMLMLKQVKNVSIH